METNVELLKKKLDELPQDKLQEVAEQAHALVPECWLPNPGPQKEAYDSPADVLLYGGQAGGGKSSLATGLALTRHKNSLLIRRQYSDMGSLIEDTLKQYGTRDGYNGSAPASLRTHDGRRIVFGGAKDPGDEEHFKGQPFDLLVLDEASQFLKSQFQFLSGWNRSAEPGQRCRILLATNPPEKPSEGQWLMEMFRPWLDPSHPNPAKPGELRWFVSDEEGEDREVDGPDIIQVGLDQDGKPRMVRPLSRTFIPARLSDNPFLTGTGYDSRLDSLPEPLRSAVRDGNWLISHDDDEWQLFPTNWLLQAQQRWTDMPPDAPMCSMGVDIAQGGKDRTVIVNRYGNWFSRPISVPGRETPQGSDVAALVMKYRRNNADVVIDMGGGYGGSAYEHLHANGFPVKGFRAQEKSSARTQDRMNKFYNKRAEAYWRFREALDPDQAGGSTIAIPPDRDIMAELVAPRFELTPQGFRIEPKLEIKQRLGRSPDVADAIIMAFAYGPKHLTHGQIWRNHVKNVAKLPKIERGYTKRRRRRG